MSVSCVPRVLSVDSGASHKVLVRKFLPMRSIASHCADLLRLRQLTGESSGCARFRSDESAVRGISVTAWG